MKEADSKDLVLNTNRTDHIATLARLVISQAPVIGPVLVEIIGSVIPDQRIDRIAKYLKVLEGKLTDVEHAVIEKEKSNENFNDLLEESLLQSAKSLTNERRDYIASLVANCISPDGIKYSESKHLLRILGELNDVEILWLRFFLFRILDGDREFREKHENIFKAIPLVLDATQQEIDKSALQKSYKEHLASLGLLEKLIRIDSKKGEIETKSYKITTLGKFLLREIGLFDSYSEV